MGPDDVPPSGAGEAEQSPPWMDDDGPSNLLQQGPIAPVIRVGDRIPDLNLMFSRPLLGIVKLPLTIARRTRADRDQPPTLDDDRGRQQIACNPGRCPGAR